MVDREHHGAQVDLDGGVFYTVDETLGILGTGELFFEIGEAKAGVNALAQDATELSIVFDDCGRSAGVGRLEGCSHARGATADNDDVIGNLVHLIIALHGTEDYFGAGVL